MSTPSIFNVFLLVIISRLIFPQTILIAFGKTKMVLLISVLETILNIILSVIFVQYFGLIGIAFGTFLAYLFEKQPQLNYKNFITLNTQSKMFYFN